MLFLTQFCYDNKLAKFTTNVFYNHLCITMKAFMSRKTLMPQYPGCNLSVISFKTNRERSTKFVNANRTLAIVILELGTTEHKHQQS